MIFNYDGLVLRLDVPGEWRRVDDEDALRWSHASGLQLVVRWRDAERGRLEVDVLPAAGIAGAPAPRLHIESDHPLIPWLGGASGEIVALTGRGPVLAQQKRGYASGSADSMGLFAEPLVVAPGHPLSSVWVFERFEGDLLDAPMEPRWLPPRRHVPLGEEIELALPDGVVTGVDAVETDAGFLLVGEPGLHTAQVGGPTGITQLEVGWFLDWLELVEAARAGAPDDLWSYLTTLLPRDVDVDELDVRLAAALETPTLWGTLAAARAVDYGLPTFDEARSAAARLVEGADVPTRIALLSRGLVDVGCLVGVQLGREAVEGLRRFGLGRVMSQYPDGAERELAAVWFWLAGMGDTALGARIGGIVALVHARALSRASQTLDPEAVAWLSLFA